LISIDTLNLFQPSKTVAALWRGPFQGTPLWLCKNTILKRSSSRDDVGWDWHTPVLMASKPETQEEKDEARLLELDGLVAEVVELLAAKVTREVAAQRRVRAKLHTESSEGEERPLLTVHHLHNGSMVPTTRRTQGEMLLVDALRLEQKVGRHPKDLEHALHTYVREQRVILERMAREKAEKKAARAQRAD
jgi:hypothetical protein